MVLDVSRAVSGHPAPASLALELDQQQRNSNDALGLDADRDNAAYVDSLGWVLFRRGKIKEARAELEKASRLPDGAHDPVVWDHLGDVYRARLRRVLLEHGQGECVIEALSVLRSDDPRVPRAPEVEAVRPLAVGSPRPHRAKSRPGAA